MRAVISTALLGLISFAAASGQNQIVVFDNPSLEGEPGISDLPQGWYYCGPAEETPPDLHPNGHFGVEQLAQDGYTYVALIGRPNGTSESIAQRLAQPLSAGQCYRLDLFASRSPQYVAVERESGQRINYRGALRLRLWGGSIRCGTDQLLAESGMVAHSDWREIQLVFQPERPVEHLILQAVHAPAGQGPYPGNVLIDNLSPIVAADCRSGAYTFQPDTLVHRAPAGPAEVRELLRELGPAVTFDPWSNQLLREVYNLAGLKGLQYSNRALHQLGLTIRDLPGHQLELVVRGETPTLIKDRIAQIREECDRLGLPKEQLRIRKAQRKDQRSDWDARNRYLFLRLR